MDFSQFDTRNYRTVGVRDGYAAWARTYDGNMDGSMHGEMDLRLLERLDSVIWSDMAAAADLACGTGRIGRWLRHRGVGTIDGVDLTPEMLARAYNAGTYRTLSIADIRATPLPAARYDLVVEVLACEHLPDLAPLFAEAARLLRPGGTFVNIGYHPHFMLNGIPTHFDDADGEPIAISTHVHLLSDHFKAARRAGLSLVEMDERIVDETWIAKNPRWHKHRGKPVSFCMVWRKD